MEERFEICDASQIYILIRLTFNNAVNTTRKVSITVRLYFHRYSMLCMSLRTKDTVYVFRNAEMRVIGKVSNIYNDFFFTVC